MNARRHKVEQRINTAKGIADPQYVNLQTAHGRRTIDSLTLADLEDAHYLDTVTVELTFRVRAGDLYRALKDDLTAAGELPREGTDG